MKQLQRVPLEWEASRDLPNLLRQAVSFTHAARTLVVFRHGTCVALDPKEHPASEAAPTAVIVQASQKLVKPCIYQLDDGRSFGITFSPEQCFSIVTLWEFERCFLEPRNSILSEKANAEALANDAEAMCLPAWARLFRDAENPEIIKISVWPKERPSLRVATMNYLLEQDRDEMSEFPVGFDYAKEMASVRSMGSALSRICGHSLRFDEHVQDASYFTDWWAWEQKNQYGISLTIVVIRFSAFGRMFRIWGQSEKNPITSEVRERLIDFLFSRGYVYVPEELLNQTHPKPQGADSWTTRFFDYV